MTTETYTHHADGTRKTPAERAASAHKFYKGSSSQPEIRPTSYAELEARQQGRKLAAEAKAAREPKKPSNPYRRHVADLEYRAAMGDQTAKRRITMYRALADKYDAEQAAKAEAEKLKKQRESDPLYKNAVEHCEAFLRTVEDHERQAALVAAEVLRQGEVDLYWQQVRDIEGRIWAREDAKAAEAALKADAALTEAKQAAEAASATSQRIQQLPPGDGTE